MGTSDIVLVLMKATLVFLAGLTSLAFAKRLPPATRHLICLLTVGGSLAILLTARLPRPLVIIHIPLLAVSTDAMGGTGTQRWVLTQGSIAQIAAAIWIAGFALVMLRFLAGCILLSKVRRSATPIGSDEKVFTADVSVPMVTGLFRPVILMPQAAAAWPEEHRNAALRHELAHLNRGDLWANFAAVVASAMYWFHPLVWVLVRRLRIEQEAACDDAVVQSGFDRAEYAEALLETARHARGTLLASCPMADEMGVKARVTRVLAPAMRPVSPALRRTSKGILAGLVLVLGAVSLVGSERIYKVEGDVTKPKVIQKIAPEYTSAAKSAKIQGEVLLNLVIGSDGLAREIVVEHGIDPGLDRNAMLAVREWRFQPAMRSGQPVAAKAAVAVNYRLR